MSADAAQARKRKDKKRKKEDEGPNPPLLHPHPVFTNNNTVVTEDVNVHVHKEGGIGGGICAKLVFFLLFSALAVLIGLIITEHRGLTDLDTVEAESRFAEIFDGWVDTKQDAHDDHDEAIDALSEEEDHEDEHDDLDEGDEDHGEEDEDHEEEEEDAEGSEEQEEDEAEEEEDNVSEVEEDEDHEGVSAEAEDDDDDDEQENEIEDEEDENEDDEGPASEEEEDQDDVGSEERVTNDDDDDDEQDDDGDDDQEDDEEDGDNDEDDGVQEVLPDTGTRKLGNSEEEEEEDDSKEKGYLPDEDEDHDGEGDDTSKGHDDDEDEGFDEKEDDESDKHDDDDDDDDDDEKISWLPSAKKVSKEQVEKQKTSDKGKPVKREATSKEEVPSETNGASNMAVRVSVGAAILLVAYFVLIRKWRNASGSNATDEHHDEIKEATPIRDRRNTIVVPPSFQEVEPDIEQEEYSEEEEGSDGDVEETVPEPRSVKSKYQELRSTYTKQLTPEHELDFEARRDADEEEEEEDEETLEEEEEAAADGDEEEEELEDEDEDYDEDEGDELLKRLDSKYGKLPVEGGSAQKGPQEQQKLQGERFQRIVGTDAPSIPVQHEPSSDNKSQDDKLLVNASQQKDDLNDKKDVADEAQNQRD